MNGESEGELRAQEIRLLTAMQDRDVGVLSRLFDREYVCSSGFGEVWGRDRALQDVTDPDTWLEQLEVEIDRIIPLANAGVVTGRSCVAGRVAGVPISGVYRFTRVWRRTQDEWTILATHTSLARAPE
jgi:hypothetical protein